MLDDLASLGQGRHDQAIQGAAVVLGNDGVLGNIHQAAGQITGVGGLERGIGQTFAGAVGGDEVLENRQAFAEIGGNRGFDDLAGRFGHEPPHTGQLADLLRPNHWSRSQPSCGWH